MKKKAGDLFNILVENFKPGVKFIAAFYFLFAIMAGAWVEFGLPIPATAEDLKRLSQGQAEIGLKVQLQIEQGLRRDLLDLRWKLNQSKQKRIKTHEQKQLELMLEKQIAELEVRHQTEKGIREAYAQRLKELKR